MAKRSGKAGKAGVGNMDGKRVAPRPVTAEALAEHAAGLQPDDMPAGPAGDVESAPGAWNPDMENPDSGAGREEVRPDGCLPGFEAAGNRWIRKPIYFLEAMKGIRENR